MPLREWELHEILEECIARVENLTLSVKGQLGDIHQSTLLEMLDQVGRLRVRLDRLTYMVEATAPLADLQDQIAVNEAADRLRVERERVASQRSAAPESLPPRGKE